MCWVSFFWCTLLYSTLSSLSTYVVFLLSKQQVLLAMSHRHKDRKVKAKRHKPDHKSAVEEKSKGTKVHSVVGRLKGHPLLVIFLFVSSHFIGGHAALRSKRSTELDVEKVEEKNEVWDGGTNGRKDGWAGDTDSDGMIAKEGEEMIMFFRQL